MSASATQVALFSELDCDATKTGHAGEAANKFTSNKETEKHKPYDIHDQGNGHLIHLATARTIVEPGPS